MKKLIASLLAVFILSAQPAIAQQVVQAVGPQTIITSQYTVSTTPVMILPARALRGTSSITLLAANLCYFGNASVTTTTGYTPAAITGVTITYNNSSALYAICALPTGVAVLESF